MLIFVVESASRKKARWNKRIRKTKNVWHSRYWERMRLPAAGATVLYTRCLCEFASSEVRITVYTIRERTWGNFAVFRRLSVPGEQIFHISRLVLHGFESVFLKSQKQQQHKTFKNPMWFSSGTEFLWPLAKVNWTAVETVSSSKVQTNFCCSGDIPLLPGPRLSNLAARGSLNRRLSERSPAPCRVLWVSSKGSVLPSWLLVSCAGKNSS